MDKELIYHIFADTGVESEALGTYGRVIRLGLDPIDTNNSEPVRADATKIPLKKGADIALLHPPCQAYSNLTSINGDASSHPELIPRARKLGKVLADDYIIENVPNAPLENPVILEGRMFGLPIVHKRAFETSFHVEQPPIYGDLLAKRGGLKDHLETGGWQGSYMLWKSIKQVEHDYPSKELKRSGTPAPYIHYLMRHWIQNNRDK